jgi:hypothetical protein
MQITQRMISTIPCSIKPKPAAGRTNLKGHSGRGSGEKVFSLIARDSLA